MTVLTSLGNFRIPNASGPGVHAERKIEQTTRRQPALTKPTLIGERRSNGCGLRQGGQRCAHAHGHAGGDNNAATNAVLQVQHFESES